VAVLTLAPAPFQAGSIDVNFFPGVGANGSVFDSAEQSDGRMLIVGSFTNFAGSGRHRIARLNRDGSVDPSFSPAWNPPTTLCTVVVQPDGKSLVGGSSIVRLLADGAIDESFSPGPLPGGAAILSLSLQPDGRIVLAGVANGRGFVRRVYPDGSADSAFNVEIGAPYGFDGSCCMPTPVSVVATQPAGVALFHPEHNHWHQSAVAEFAVRRTKYGEALSAGVKITFCFVDVEFTGATGSAKKAQPRTYFECNGDLQGLASGWADSYHQSTPLQELDITGLKAGDYYLTHLADPENHWLESNEANNFTWVKFRLSRKGANPEISILDQSDCVPTVICGFGGNPESPRAVVGPAALAGDVLGQEPDLHALFLRVELDDVANRDYPDDLPVVGEHRKVSDPPLGHDGHALVDRGIRPDVDELRRRDLPHGSRPLVATLERHAAEVVPLGDDARQPLALVDEKRADVALDHGDDRVVDGR
jgi:uncharacterized delta-60 repeat protein